MRIIWPTTIIWRSNITPRLPAPEIRLWIGPRYFFQLAAAINHDRDARRQTFQIKTRFTREFVVSYDMAYTSNSHADRLTPRF